MDMNTAQTCESQGVVFVPMVLEATGTWEKGAAFVLRHISRAVASRQGEEPRSRPLSMPHCSRSFVSSRAASGPELQ